MASERRKLPTAGRALGGESVARAKRGGAREARGDGVAIRPAEPKDVPRIWELEKGLAVYEKMENRVTGSAERLAEHLFGPRRIVDCLVAEEGGVIVGFALYYLIYSSFRTQTMMWLEDLFVVPEHRGRGTGRVLLHATAREAARLGCWRLSWAVLEWNEPAIGFYESLGAKRDEGGWYVYQFDEERLRAVATEA